MSKELLFEKIRKEEVILWAGAGLSISSGFPSGEKLKQIIYDSLTDDEKQQIDKNSSLDVLADNVVTLRSSRNHLIDILNKEFSKTPVIESVVHKNIALIPHFKTIITTNYDRLIEGSIKNSIPIYNDKRIPYINNDRKTKVIKVHGDLEDPDSLIITKEDYNKLIGQGGLNSAVWTLVKNYLTSNSVMFIGYGVEDSNLLILLSDIEQSVGLNRKEYFFVSPNISPLKKKQLERKGILYIDSSGEALIEEVILNIKENINSDLKNNMVSADTYKDFMDGFKLIPSLTVRGNVFDISKIQSKEPIEIKSEFTISDKAVAESIINHINSPSSKSITIEESALKAFKMWFSGVKWDLTSTITKLELLPIPTNKGFIDIFFDDGFNVNIKASVYTNNRGAEIKLKLDAGEILLDIENLGDKINAKINIQRNQNCLNVSSEILFFNLLVRINNGENITIITESGKKYHQQLKGSKIIEDFSLMLNYFKNLDLVEKFFKIKFKKFSYNDISQSTSRNVDKLITIIKGEEFESILNGEIKFKINNPESKDSKEELNELDKNKVLRLTWRDNETMNLHGVEFDLGLKHYFITEPQFINEIDELGVKYLKLNFEKCPVKGKYITDNGDEELEEK